MQQETVLVVPPTEVSCIESEQTTTRLLGIIAAQGVQAVLSEVGSAAAALLSLADACFATGLTAAGQYLNYLACPYQAD